MFKEILWFKPQLEPAATKKMEKSLVDRFGKVAKKFGSGLVNVLKGSVGVISVALLAKLLNPIEAVQEKIQAILNQGKDARELADRFGSSTGEFVQLQKVAEALGVSNEDLNGALEKFASALTTAEKEFQNLKPGESLTGTSALLKNFIGSENIVSAFKEAMQSINLFGVGPQRGENGQGLMGPAAIRFAQEQIFGERFTGSFARLAGANIAKEAARLRLPSIDALGGRSDRAASLEDVRRAAEVGNRSRDFIQAVDNTRQSFPLDIERRRAAADAILTQQIAGFANLSRTADALDKTTKALEDLRGSVLQLITPLLEILPTIASGISTIAKWIAEFGKTGFRFFGGGKK